MKKVLGLDLGVGSIGWALISVNDNHDPEEILGMGSRIVPLSSDESNEFSNGNAASKNQKRTQKRTTRKGYNRYQLRRQLLTDKLRSLGMLPDEHLIKLTVLELWTLRARAATPGEKLSLPEIGRVMYHINQKRGYRHSKDDASDSKQKEYVRNIENRYNEILAEGKTIGQHFAKKLKESEVIVSGKPFYTYRIKEQVFPRKAYMEEFDKIIDCQKRFYPEVFTQENVKEIRDEIIFYQRALKSCKHLVSLCEFETQEYRTKDGKTVPGGPKVAPKSSPVFQCCKIWEEINNIRIVNHTNEELYINPEKRQDLFKFLDTHEKLTADNLNEILDLKKEDRWIVDKAASKGLTGNTTKVQLKKALSGFSNTDDILSFNLKERTSSHYNNETGEVYSEIDPSCENEPLYRLWHIVYSIDNKEDLSRALATQFGITDETIVEKLHKLDFTKQGYGNRSAKFMRQILPLLQAGAKYSEACEDIGINHSGSLTKAENQARTLLEQIPQLNKNELRQPVVEKILNQMINVVNAIIAKYGAIDEIRVELARELKLSREAREDTAKHIREREKKNKEIADKISELGLVPSKNKILKYRLWEEAEKKCFYCGQTVNAKAFLSGIDSEIEHVIPKSLLFDDSFSNKVCACRACNEDKKNRTAYDYMKSKGEDKFEDYLRRVNDAFTKKAISKTKRDRLLTPSDKIPKDFIARQLVQTQYISRKATELLKMVCHDVYGSSGDVTAYLRHIWGYDNILHDLDLPRYREGGLTGMVEREHKGQKHTEERIQEWSKRLDHRHHAIDALTIAETRQSVIQRLNTLSAQAEEVEERMSLDKWTEQQPHISVAEMKEKASSILISFKPGKKVTTPGKRYVYRGGKPKLVQSGLLVPRGALSEESVYDVDKCTRKEYPGEEPF